MSGIERIRSEHVQDGDPGDPHCAMCSDASYPIWPCDAAILLALLAERDAAVARAESVIRKALNDLDHGSLWDARAALAAASEGE